MDKSLPRLPVYKTVGTRYTDIAHKDSKGETMVRTSLFVSIMMIAIAGLAFAGDKTTDAWASADCEVCGGMYAMMDHLTVEQHNLKNGIMTITIVEDGYTDQYNKAKQQMMQAAMKLQAGEEVELCGSCVAFGKCMQQGPTQDYVQAAAGDIMILTSDNPDLVKQLQMWVAKNNEVRAQMTKDQE